MKELFNEIITNKIQKELSLKVKKIYPPSLCEIRMLRVIEAKK
jgi:ribosomal protein S3AE